MSYDITPRELARRERHGIHVALLWHPGDDALSVTVADTTKGEVLPGRRAAPPRAARLRAPVHVRRLSAPAPPGSATRHGTSRHALHRAMGGPAARDLAAKAGGWGYDGLELACWGDHFDVPAALADGATARAGAQLLERHGLRC